MTLLADLAPFLLGGLLGWTGAQKAFGRDLRRQAADSALVKILNDLGLGGLERTVLALRSVGFVELAVAAALLAVPTSTVPAVAVVLLGLGFLGYLGYARAKAPGSSCGCTAGPAPIGVRSFVRAGLVVVGGLAALAASAPWWEAMTAAPSGSSAVVLGAVIVAGALTSDLDHLWLLPLRRLRLRLFGNPLAAGAYPSGRAVPLAASMELLYTSLAWQAATPLVRSGLVEHWDADGWRILRYTGSYPEDGLVGAPSADDAAERPGTEHAGRPVSVLFALPADASIATTANPIVRMTVVDEETQEILPAPEPVMASGDGTS